MRLVFLTSTLLALVPLWGHSAVPQGFCDPNIPGRLSNRYTVNNDDTVTDRVTGLTWQRCPLGEGMIAGANECGNILRFTWKEALNWPVNAKLKDNTAQNAAIDKLASDGWRLPNVKELFSLLELQCRHNKFDVSAFPMTENVFWSNTPDVTKNGVTATSTQVLPASGGPGGRPAIDFKPSSNGELIIVVNESLSFYHQAYYVDFQNFKIDRTRIVDVDNSVDQLYKHATLLVCEQSKPCSQGRPGGGTP